jgi:hypothetical protein
MKDYINPNSKSCNLATFSFPKKVNRVIYTPFLKIVL